MAEIVLEHLDKRYPNGFHAVKDLSLEIREAELLVLVGPSGCGKTTALRMIAGLEQITAGDLYIGGRRMNYVPEKDRDIAMVFQSYALYPHMTVAQNIGFTLKLAKRPRREIRERVAETARMIGLEGMLDRRPKQLSGGQRQRVAMGRAIIRRPQAFLMDEPLSNLDAQLRVQMRGEISGLQQRLGVTTVYVTHDQVEAMTMGHRVAVLLAGELQQVDTPTRLYDHPANLFVAGFIGSPPMNLAHGIVERGDGGPVVRMGEVAIPVDDRFVEERGLGAWLGKPLVVGVRPEDLHGRGENGAVRIRGTAQRVEALGASLLVYFPVAAQPVRTAGLAAAVGGTILEEAPIVEHAAGARFCATFEPRAGLQPGQSFEAFVDPRRLHFFDPETEGAVS
jgi:multiple sugar transport system ATP-binding protein